MTPPPRPNALNTGKNFFAKRAVLGLATVVETELDTATGLDKDTAEDLMVDFLAGGFSFVAIISFF